MRVVKSERRQKGIAISRVGLTEGSESKLYYEVKGTGSAPVVLLHDGLLDSRVWDEQIETFTRYHTVIRYDRRGYGRSEPPCTKFSDSEDLCHLLRSLGVRSAHLIGMSNGGRVALDFTLKHPSMVDSLVLVGSSLGGYRFSEETRSKIATTLSAVNMWLA